MSEFMYSIGLSTLHKNFLHLVSIPYSRGLIHYQEYGLA